MRVPQTVSTAFLIGVSMLASASACAEDGDAKASSNLPAARPDGAKDGKAPTRALPAKKDKGATFRAKGWNEMTAEEQQEAHRLWLARPKKWDEMTPAEQNAAHKAWLFSSGDFGRGRGRSSSAAPKGAGKASAPKQNVPAN